MNRPAAKPLSRNRSTPRKPAALATATTDNVTLIIYGSQMFRLRKPIKLRSYHEGGLFVHEYKPLGISAYGPTEQESRAAFAEEFSSCWQWIALEQDQRLTAGARQLKAALLDLVEAAGENGAFHLQQNSGRD